MNGEPASDRQPAQPEITETAWVIELDQLCIGKCNGKPITCTFTDPKAMRFKQQGDALFEASQLEVRFPWMKSRLAVREHMWIFVPPREEQTAQCSHRNNIGHPQDGYVRLCTDCGMHMVNSKWISHEEYMNTCAVQPASQPVAAPAEDAREPNLATCGVCGVEWDDQTQSLVCPHPRKTPSAIDLVERYWKQGCRCLTTSTVMCDICTQAVEVLKREGRMMSR